MSDQTLPGDRRGPAAVLRIPEGLRGLLRSSGLVIAARAGGVIVGLATQVALARILPLSDLGVFFIAMSTAMVLAILCTAGYPMILPRFAAAAGKGGEHALARILACACHDMWRAAGLACLPPLIVVALWPGFDDTLRACLAIGIVTAPVLAVMRLNGALANALRHFALGFVPDLLVRPVVLLIAIAGLWLVMPGVRVETVLLAHIAIAAVLALWQGLRVARVNPARAEGPVTTDRPERRSARAQAFSMLVAMAFTAVIADLDLLFASAMLDTARTGIFGVCLKMAMIAAFAVHAVHQVSVRDAADAVHDGDHGALKTVLRRANGLSLALSLACLAGTVLLGRWVLGIFGPEFVEGYICLVILMAAQVARALAGPAMQIMAMTGNEKDCARIFAACLALLAVLNVALVPAFGLIGAALAFFAAMTAWPVWLALRLKRASGINPAMWPG